MKFGDVVVLDMGGTSIRLGHLNKGEPCTKFKLLGSEVLRVDDACERLVSIISTYATESMLELSAVVLGLPGMLDRANDGFSHCNNIPQLEGFGLQKMLSSSLGCDVILEQDIMLQLLGEWRQGAAVSSPSVFGVYFGTGIGAAYLVDGNPRLHNAAGLQAGHIPIMAQGKLCVCGNTDCIEAYACGHTLLELAKNHDCPVELLFTRTSDPALRDELEHFLLFQAYMLATLITLFVPDMILVGGGIPQMQGYPKDKLIANVRKHLQQPYPANDVKIQWASLGPASALHGAQALLELEHSAHLT